MRKRPTIFPTNFRWTNNIFFNTEKNNNFGPSKICWENSWSLSPINNKEKFKLENFWNQSLTP